MTLDTIETMRKTPPTSESELMDRAILLAGLCLQDVASQCQDKVPNDLRFAKGWMGQLLEKALGANAMNLDQPDFMNLGIELKTLPVTANGKPRESTYICTAPIPCTDLNWKSSRVWRKMARMLWVPIESTEEKPLRELIVGTPFLWSPTPEIEAILQQDWEEMTEYMMLGLYENISAHKGQYLQLRPKAQNAKTLVKTVNHEGQTISVVPKGFYLRSTFTQKILSEQFYVAANAENCG